MCTVSWLHEDGGFHLLCNRDEKRTRQPAQPPRLGERGGLRYVAPSDGDFGGAWICANEAGVALCLLNGANLGGAVAAVRVGSRSRGLLLLDLADSSSALEACARLARLDLEDVAPFTLTALEPGLPACLAEWNGSELVVLPHGDAFMPLVSSSYETEAVRRRRREEYAQRTRRGLDVRTLYGFHESHAGAASAYSPCMHRLDAETVSFSWIRVDEQAVDFFYSPAAPCRWAGGESVRLERLS